jgi:hypothetical protein
MAELTVLETKLAEVIGLAQAAQGTGEKVSGLLDDNDLKSELDRMQKEAEETERRSTEIAEHLDGKKTAILDKARETKQEATEMMQIYLGQDADGLDGFEFLTMAEAAELGHWSVVGELNGKARDPRVQELVDWALPLQQQHLDKALQGSLTLAAKEDPQAPA